MLFLMNRNREPDYKSSAVSSTTALELHQRFSSEGCSGERTSVALREVFDPRQRKRVSCKQAQKTPAWAGVIGKRLMADMTTLLFKRVDGPQAERIVQSIREFDDITAIKTSSPGLRDCI